MDLQVNKNVVPVVWPDRISPVRKYAAILAGAVLMLVVTSAMNADVTGVTGGGQSHFNIQPSQAVNYIIALEGTFPSRDITGDEGASGDIGTLGLEPFIGEVSMFGGNFAPRGWALCDGQLLSVSQYTALFSILGTTYGGDGRTTFALPDLRGRMPIGPGSGPGLTPRSLGQKSGAETATVSVAQMASHHHTLPQPVGGTLNNGGNQGHANMQPFLGLNPIIAMQGLFPPRNITAGGDDPVSADGNDPFLGGMTYFAGNFAPRGWALAEGQLLSISSNSALFSLLGTTYGGDGRTDFALPDLRGRTAIGEGTGPGLTHRNLGQKLGAETVALSVNELPSHSHSLPLPSSLTLGGTGSNQSHTNMAPSLGLNYIIALQGVFPSRSVTEGGDDPTTLADATPFIGEISIFGGNFAPRSWAFCDGQLLPIAQNTALFALLGTTYGGDGRNTFGLPDLRGRAALHAGTGPGLSNWRLGEEGGFEAVALNLNQLPSHDHLIEPGPSAFGDLDGDWDIDSYDYNTFTGQLGMSALPGVLAADFDNDGDVDLDDLAIMRGAFGFGVPASAAAVDAAATTPEPSSAALLVLGLGAVVRRRRS